MQAESTDIKELCGDTLLKVNPDDKNKIDKVEFSKFWKDCEKAEFICLYYGAHYVPPSRLLTENLKTKVYDKLNKDGECKFEVIFVSDDRKEDHFERNFKKMPWYAIPFGSEQKMLALKAKYNVIELPTRSESTV